MFDISWGETFVLFAIGAAAIGKKDLPRAAGFLGDRVGRVVGFLQGARARADQFAQNNELHALQNELRSGMRELNTVKGELVLAASSQGMIGRSLGRNRNPVKPLIPKQGPTVTTPGLDAQKSQHVGILRSSVPTGLEYMNAAKEMCDNSETIAPSQLKLSPKSQTTAAVAEEEWQKLGMGFKSLAEHGTGQYSSMGSSQAYGSMHIGGGSALLSDLIQQNLIHDQYERTVMEQDQLIQSKIDKSRRNR